MPDEAPLERPEGEVQEDGFHSSNLFPPDTGLPMTVWIGERAGARHDVRVKASEAHGRRAPPDRMASVAVRPEPGLVDGDLSRGDLALVSEWIRLDEAVIIGHREARAGTLELARRLRPLPG